MQHTLLLNSVNFFTAKIKVIVLNMTFIIKNFKIQTSLDFVNYCRDYFSIVTKTGCCLPVSNDQNGRRPLKKTVTFLMWFIIRTYNFFSRHSNSDIFYTVNNININIRIIHFFTFNFFGEKNGDHFLKALPVFYKKNSKYCI